MKESNDNEECQLSYNPLLMALLWTLLKDAMDPDYFLTLKMLESEFLQDITGTTAELPGVLLGHFNATSVVLHILGTKQSALESCGVLTALYLINEVQTFGWCLLQLSHRGVVEQKIVDLRLIAMSMMKEN